MITRVDGGAFELTETRHGTKILALNDEPYVWIVAPGIGSLLIYTDQPQEASEILSKGHFRLFTVRDEPELSDLLHLELEFSKNEWQGYLLPTGLPDEMDTRKRLIATHQTISSDQRSRKIDLEPLRPTKQL
jgi:hypothetical protein